MSATDSEFEFPLVASAGDYVKQLFAGTGISTSVITAHHEAGHAIVLLALGFEVARLRSMAGEGDGGLTQAVKGPDDVYRFALVLLGGSAGESLQPDPRNFGCVDELSGVFNLCGFDKELFGELVVLVDEILATEVAAHRAIVTAILAQPTSQCLDPVRYPPDGVGHDLDGALVHAIWDEHRSLKPVTIPSTPLVLDRPIADEPQSWV